MSFDCISAIEACYASAADDAAWLAGMARTLCPLAQELPPAAATFRFDAEGFVPGEVAVVDPALTPMYREVLGAWRAVSPEVVRRWFSAVPPVALASARIRTLPAHMIAQVEPFFSGRRVNDSLGVLALEPDGNGSVLTIPYPRPPRLAPRIRHQLARFTAHLATALRLRLRTQGAVSPDHHTVEAVLDPAGRVRHATGAARGEAARVRLASAVRDVERARGRLRRTSPEEAAALWEGLVSGRWSLVDHVEADGRRLVLVRRNEPGTRDPRALAEAERDVLAYVALGHSNKYVGYMLGLAPSTVATHLARGMRKLGLASRREVIAVLGPLASEAHES